MGYIKWMIKGIKEFEYNLIGKILYVFGILFLVFILLIIIPIKIFGEYGLYISMIFGVIFGSSWVIYHIDKGVFS